MKNLPTLIVTFTTAILLSSFFSLPTYAVKPDEDSAVSQNFKKVGRTFRAVKNAKTSEELLEILQTAKESLTANKSEVPSFMEEGTAQHQEFLDGLDDTIARLDKAIALAEADDFDGAVAQFGEVRGAKKEYHKQFELED